MNKHFNINYADHESDWKDLTIVRLLSEVSDLEDKIDKAIEYIEKNLIEYSDFKYVDNDDELNIDCESIKELFDILKGSDKE